MMTYLQLVNAVLRRIRADEVSTVSETRYSALIGDLVNDAKDLVAAAWDWSALRPTIIVTTVSGTQSYSLTGSRDDVKILEVTNATSTIFLQYVTDHWMINQSLNSSTTNSSPSYYTFDGVDSNGDSKIKVFPIPDGVYTLNFKAVVRNPTLTANATQIVIPTAPILHLAVALAARERGETGGQTTVEYFSVADQYLADAVSLDANKHPEELIFKVV